MSYPHFSNECHEYHDVVADYTGHYHGRQPQIVAICGSTSQRAGMADLNRKLTLDGAIVLAPGVFQHDGDELTPEQKVELDRLHFAKIDLADRVHFLRKSDGSFGSSTTREFEYAVNTKGTDRIVVWRDPVSWWEPTRDSTERLRRLGLL